MEAIHAAIVKVFSFAKSEGMTFHDMWDQERSRASRFGPSHVSEIDAIFARHN